MTEKRCYSDSEKICDEKCAAYNPDGFIIVRTPKFDKSRVHPEWIWIAGKAYKAAMCKASGFAIELKQEVSADEEGNLIVPGET